MASLNPSGSKLSNLYHALWQQLLNLPPNCLAVNAASGADKLSHASIFVYTFDSLFHNKWKTNPYSLTRLYFHSGRAMLYGETSAFKSHLIAFGYVHTPFTLT